MIVFSDGLDIPRCLALKKASSEAGIGCSFGVGTNLTNDYVIVPNPLKNQEVPGEGDIRIDTGEGKSKALNMVIKLFKINGEFCVKISDELTKVCIFFYGNPTFSLLAMFLYLAFVKEIPY